jgi:hypothetical protein
MPNSRISDLTEKAVLYSNGTDQTADDDALLLLARSKSHNETITYKNFKNSVNDHGVLITGNQFIEGEKTFANNAFFQSNVSVDGHLTVRGDIFNVKFDKDRADPATLGAYDASADYVDGDKVSDGGRAWKKIGDQVSGVHSTPSEGADWTDVTVASPDSNLTQLDSNLETKGNLIVDGTSELKSDVSVLGSITGNLSINTASKAEQVNINGNVQLEDGNAIKTANADLIYSDGTTVKIGNAGGLEVSTTKDATVGNDLLVKNNLTVEGTASLDTDLSVLKSLTVEEGTILKGAVTVKEDAIFEKDVSILKDLTVKGDVFNIKFESGVDPNSLNAYDAAVTYSDSQQVSHNGKAWQKTGANQSEPAVGGDWADITLTNVDGETDLDSDLIVKGDAVLQKDLGVTGTTTVQDLVVNGSMGFTNLSVPGTLGVTGLVSADGGIAVDTDKFTVADTTGNTAIAGALQVTGTISADGGLNVPGLLSADVAVMGSLSAGGSGQFSVEDNTGNVTTSGTLGVTGLVSADGGIAVDTDKFTVADTTGNTAIAGTLGVTGDTTLGDLDASTLDTTGAVTIGTTLGVTGLVSADGGIAVDTDKFTVADTTGNTAIAGTLGVTGDTTLGDLDASTLDTTGAVTIGTTLEVTGLVSADGGIAVDTDKFTVEDGSGNVTTKGNVVVEGTLSCANVIEATPTLPMLGESFAGTAVVIPDSPSAEGTKGDIRADSNYIYVCTQTTDGNDGNAVAWKRLLLSSW